MLKATIVIQTDFINNLFPCRMRCRYRIIPTNIVTAIKCIYFEFALSRSQQDYFVLVRHCCNVRQITWCMIIQLNGCRN